MTFGYTTVSVPYISDALAFYEKVLGFQTPFLHESGRYGELEPGATTLALASQVRGEMNLGANVVPVSAAIAPSGIELPFVTEDVLSAYGKAIAAGAVLLHAPTDTRAISFVS